MLLIVGLGNPGPKYQSNRHNVGQMFVDYLFNELSGFQVNQFKTERFFNSQIAKFAINNNEIILAKPQTFMNNSGIAVNKLVKNFIHRIVGSNFVVIHDDLDIPLGKFHIQFASGPQLHNGLESIEQHLKTKDFYRVRIGVDNRLPDKKIPGETYALQNFLFDEKKLLQSQIFPKISAQMKLDFKVL